MLEVVNYKKDEYAYPALLVLGCFDAIHIGHAELLKKAKLQAKINGLDLGVMMFNAGKGGKQVFSFEDRCAFLEKYNVKFILNIDFTDEFKKITPAQFLSDVEEFINVKGYMSGKDFRFGAGAKGKSSTLKNYADNEDNGVWYMSLKDVTFEGEKVSTTLIKSCLESGKVTLAAQLLGRKFFVKGTVHSGAERGTGMGIPTANINYPENITHVKQGVYGVEVCFGGETHSGVANFGARPTFGEEAPVLETYLLDYDGDLYGKEITVEFVNYIRPIHKFSSAEALCVQIKEDLTKIGNPDADTEAEEPVTEEVTEEPVIEETVEEPVTEETVEEPVVEEVTEEPATEEVTEEPVTEEVTEEPVTEETVEEPATEETAEEPVTEEVTEEPTTEETAEEPVTEEVTEEPTTEEAAEELVSEETVEEPATEETVEEPVNEEVTEELVIEEIIEEPVNEEVTEEPVTEETAEEPVTEEVTEEPVTEETAEEPVTEAEPEKQLTEEELAELEFEREFAALLAEEEAAKEEKND